MKCFYILAVVVVFANGAADYMRYTDHPPNDPDHMHCRDVSVDTSDVQGKDWLSANEYQFTSWKKGLCDPKVFPVVESTSHPDGVNAALERKCGHNRTVTPLEGDFAQVSSPKKTVDCRPDKTKEAISIQFTNGAKVPVKIRGCQNQYACKPYVDCDVSFASGAEETLVLDATFKYFVLEFKGNETGSETELYPDANLKWRKMCTIEDPPKKPICRNEGEVVQLVAPLASDDIVLHMQSPGNHAHCTEIHFFHGKDNKYWQAHGYQYTSWKTGQCDRGYYNWFNRNTTIAQDVVQEIRGHKAK
jgi:hypothetical protein